MNKTELEQMELYEKTYWWHIGKKNLVNEIIKKLKLNKNVNILEIGCGTGEITETLLNFGEVYANDIAQLAINKVESRGIKNTILGDINKIDLSRLKGKFDLVLALDVLEHIKDDKRALENINSLLKDKGILIITVPAYKFLWSTHDEALEHQRRYTGFEIEQKLIDTNFDVLKQSHFVFFSFPAIALTKFLSNFFSKNVYPKTSYIVLPDILNSLMVKILMLETYLMEKVRLPFGTTIFVLARKN